MSPREQFEANLPLIERIIGSICGRCAVAADDTEDFRSWVMERFLEDDCAVLGKFRGQSKLSTYLTTVIHNLFRDWRIKRWGKWRPSVRARRLGDVAMQLETLVSRDRIPEREAVAIVVDRQGHRVERETVEALLEELPYRSGRPTFETGTSAQHALEHAADPETPVERATRLDLDPLARHLEAGLAGAMEQLDDQDRLILKLRFQEGFKIVDIAHALQLEAKSLYPRIERLLRVLRRELEGQGLGRDQLRELLSWRDRDLRVPFEGEEARSRPSQPGSEGAQPPTDR